MSDDQVKNEAKRSKSAARRARRKKSGSPSAARQGAAGREVSSALIDPDERLWRSLSGSDRDIPGYTHSRMQRLAYELWLTNLMGQRLIEVVTDHVVGEGVAWHSEDAAALDTVRAFWSDPVNQMDLRFERLVSELGIFGELLLPAAISEYEGRVRLGYVSPRLIEEVVPDPDNCALPIGVIIRGEEGTLGGKRKERRVRTVLGGDPREYLGAAGQRERERFRDGEAFLFQINKASDATRGTSDLLAAIDWIDIYERFIFDAAERARVQNSFIYDVTLKGAGPEGVAKWLDENGVAPRPSSVRVHNEKEEWRAVTPDLKSGESGSQGIAKMMRGLVLGGMGIPSHWFAQGDDVNRASAESMDQPTIKKMTRRQRTIRHILQALADKQLEEAHRAGRLPEAALRAGARPVLPEISIRDTEKISASLLKVTEALDLAAARGWTSDESASALFSHMAGQLGDEG
ncbi:MAG: hypothetical protein HOC91_16025 [Nitrospinaceae bacterium]|jgi:hypothetical protein|nr:hypothetical protein [Nitrospinaceae bacterium]MBT4095473.1 hypothetical protein [Nitrospinaceae bacterium]MBT4432017.1 hypothetical protein [Nitrospinaceae bacterium]MBT5366467.1 hypothetical protein [Nitrospinaceae bacterium]MBT6396434.1 hypothetical protein [Nitrospinaceae bacterium]